MSDLSSQFVSHHSLQATLRMTKDFRPEHYGLVLSVPFA